MTHLPFILPSAALLPEWILDTDFFQILATFVALNSLMYATLAVLKVLPRGYAFSRFSGRNRRRANRSIYPEPSAQDRVDIREHASALADERPNDPAECA